MLGACHHTFCKALPITNTHQRVTGPLTFHLQECLDRIRQRRFGAKTLECPMCRERNDIDQAPHSTLKPKHSPETLPYRLRLHEV